MTSSRKPRESKKPPWAGAKGPGYEFNEEGDLVWFESASFMARRSSGSSKRSPKTRGHEISCPETR
jgi:hypothetical protein